MMKARTPTRGFYDEYLSVCDMTAEFYLQTVDVVFQQHLLPRASSGIAAGGRSEAIKDTPLLAIEGERDDISGIGQTKAALDLATGLRPSSNITSPGTSAITASSTAASGARRSRPWSRSLSPRTPS